MLKKALIAVGVVCILAVGGIVLAINGPDPKITELPEDFPFAPLADPDVTDPDNPARRYFVDFAKVEHDLPLSNADRMLITPENLTLLSQEEVDQIYARLPAGPIPDGDFLGDLFMARDNQDSLKTRLEVALGGLAGDVGGRKVVFTEKLGRTIWKGKRFNSETGVLRNFIEDIKPLERLIDDPDSLETATVPREGWLSYILPTTTVWMMFPAKLYCGQSLLDGRRESVIIDYAFSDDIDGYQQHPDSLGGRQGFRIRDEIRMVRPGFYLGRAYINRVFLLNFTLYNADLAEAHRAEFESGAPLTGDCYIGEQMATALGR